MNANKAVIPFFQFPVLCLLGLLFCLDSESCKAQHEEKNKQTASLNVGQIDSNKNTVPYWQLPYNEQVKIAEPYHTYGNYTLRWQGGKSYSYEEQQDSFLLRIKEDHPGILLYERKPIQGGNNTENTFQIEYYEIGTGKLKKRIDLEVNTPYDNSKYKNITIGGIDYELDEVTGRDSNCNLPKLPSPNIYRTYNLIRTIGENGYVCVSFILTKLHKPTRYVVGWEQTLLVLNENGDKIYSLILEYDTPEVYISPTGNYIAFNKESESVINPISSCGSAIEIHDLQEKKKIFEYRCNKYSVNDGFKEIEGLLYSRFFVRKNSLNIQLIINIEKKEYSEVEFKWDKPLLPEIKEYLNFLKSLPTKSRKF